jgi:signal transduction histidine kinase
MISVTDSGIGLERKDLDRIFEPFEQADGSSSRKYQGTGLGLSLTKKLVQLHGGSIWAESEGKGCGSTFHFVLPSEGMHTQEEAQEGVQHEELCP